jgi:hypothetical protein
MHNLLNPTNDGLPALFAETTNLSASRTTDGNSENARSINAVDSPSICRSDSAGLTVQPLASAPPAPTSRRGFLMNTIVSAASIAAATAVAVSPISATASPGPLSEPIEVGPVYVMVAEPLPPPKRLVACHVNVGGPTGGGVLHDTLPTPKSINVPQAPAGEHIPKATAPRAIKNVRSLRMASPWRPARKDPTRQRVIKVRRTPWIENWQASASLAFRANNADNDDSCGNCRNAPKHHAPSLTGGPFARFLSCVCGATIAEPLAFDFSY